MMILTYFNPFHPDLKQREKINLNFYFDTSLCCFKWFHEVPKGRKGRVYGFCI